jgi:hypothetical protein
LAEEASEKMIETVVVEKKLVQEDKDDKEYKDRMVIRSYSSMILLIPSFITALVLGITQIIMNRGLAYPPPEAISGSGYMNIMGIVFLTMFSLNLILVAFDFNRARTIIIVLILVVIAATLLLVNAYTGFLSGGGGGGFEMRIYFSTQVYFALAALLLFILLFTFLGSLFNYYVIEGNELLHHKGIGGGVERYPANNMSVVKEYPDLIELLIFRSGTLVLTPPRSERSIILKNVIGINKKVRHMNEILSRLKVDIN